jgi:hypothetical protein
MLFSLPPIKGFSSLRSSSKVDHIAISSATDHASIKNLFTCDDVLNALVAMFITVPAITCVDAGAFYTICVKTLSRNQSQIASKLGLSKISAPVIRDHFLREYTPASATAFLRNHCFEVRAPSLSNRSSLFGYGD